MDFSQTILLQAMEHYMPVDALKQCYQVAYGPNHMLEREEEARAYFYREFHQAVPADEPIYVYISPDYMRVNLRAWKLAGLKPEELYSMFYLTARMPVLGDSRFFALQDEVRGLARMGKLPFTWQQWDYTILNYMNTFPAPVRHSKAYREFLHPSYRVVSTKFIPVIDLLLALSGIESPKVIAIDGMAGAGKTTMATLFSQVTGAEVVHMDDFFLPPQLRRAERLAEAGGNIHYERFCREVLPWLGKDAAFSYRKFDCGRMDYTENVELSSQRPVIVEGSYSCHPAFGDYADLKLFLKVSEKTQRQRILARNLSEEMTARFFEQWIPMENTYHAAFCIKSNADLVLSTEQ